jgi:DNA-binding XRE family transcriptional regulator
MIHNKTSQLEIARVIGVHRQTISAFSKENNLQQHIPLMFFYYTERNLIFILKEIQ